MILLLLLMEINQMHENINVDVNEQKKFMLNNVAIFKEISAKDEVDDLFERIEKFYKETRIIN